MTFYCVSGGNILPLYDYMPNYSVISSNNYHLYYLDKMYISAGNMDSKRTELISSLQGVYHLISFAYNDTYKFIQDKIPPSHLIIDSGGFTINSLGINLDIDDYIRFLGEIKYKYAFNFDIIRDAEQTYKNQKYMEGEGVDVIPVFHLGDSYKYLQNYIDEGYDYISLGGMVGKGDKVKRRFLNKCFTLGFKGKGIKFHGLGLGHNYCKDYPLFSIDNSNHIMVRRRGQMKINGNSIKIPKVYGESREERRWNDAKPVLIQLLNNIKEYEEIVKDKWYMYDKYFQGNVSIEEVIG